MIVAMPQLLGATDLLTAGRAWLGNLEGWTFIGVVVAAWLGLVAVLLFLLTQVRYRVGPKHLKVTLLGIPVRRVRLDNIRNVHTRKSRFVERWQEEPQEI
jgi:hypothetical protein